ncbi:DUF6082 family protein [Nonomuraea sp. NPDC003727]
MRRWIWRTTVVWFALMMLLLAGGLLIFSPLAMARVVELTPGLDWSLLSDIGQAYGPAATLLAAISLIGVALSVVVQARSVRISALQMARAQHLEMVRLGMDTPDLMQVLEAPLDGQDHQTRQMRMYYNLWLVHWLAMYELGQLPDNELRMYVADAFKGEIARQHWASARASFSASSRTRSRAFCRVVDEELNKAQRFPARPVIRQRHASSDTKHVLMALGVGAALTASIAALLRRR